MPAEEWRKAPGLLGMLKHRGRPTYQRRHMTASLITTNGEGPALAASCCQLVSPLVGDVLLSAGSLSVTTQILDPFTVPRA